MLTRLFKNQNNKFILFLENLFKSPLYILLIAVMAAVAEIFSIEIIAFYVFFAFGVIVPSLFGKDMTGLIAPLIMMPICISLKTGIDEPTIIMGKNILHFFIIFPLGIILLVARFVFDLITNPERRHIKPRMLIGIIILSVAYLCGGLVSPFASFESTFFGLREVAAITIAYFYFLYTIDWTRFKKDYFAWVFLFYGLVIAAEIFVFWFRDAGLYENVFVKFGWGISNDAACHLAMCVGPIGYLVIKKKQWFSWMFVLAILVVLTACIFTDSRGGTIAIAVVSLITLIIIEIKAKVWAKIISALLGIAYAVAFALSFYVLKIEWLVTHFDKLSRFWSDLFAFGDVNHFLSGRITIWQYGIDQFFDHPLFGVGWLQCADEFGFVWPARYHDTLVQVLASTGIIGFIGYFVYRVQSSVLSLKNPTIEKVMLFMIGLGLFTAGLVDNHFFNVWPVVTYSVVLAMIEGEDLRKAR